MGFEGRTTTGDRFCRVTRGDLCVHGGSGSLWLPYPKKSIMSALIEIACSLSKKEAMQTIVEAFCKEAGGLLIGRSIYQETDEILLIVRLPYATNVSKHMAILSRAFQQELIISFRCVTCDLVKVSFDPSMSLEEQMRDFPLRSGESWFPAILDPHQVYVCMSRPLMAAKQAAWILEHEAPWAFV